MIKPPSFPLSQWANALLAGLGGLDAQLLMLERAALNGFNIPGRISAGGGCRFFETADGAIALNLSREDDEALLPALLQREIVYDLESTMREHLSAELVAQGRMLGLAIASLDEGPLNPACVRLCGGLPAARSDRPLVVDFSSLWAGPLTSHLLGQMGAEVVKVESVSRSDAMREGDPALFARINQDKASVAVNWPEDREAIMRLLQKADFVIEASRPRALLRLGLDADALVRSVPGLVWISITGHGIGGGGENWIGFGDDCSVAGGLSKALFEQTGVVGFVGDAIADPLTGIYAARRALAQRETGIGGRLSISMAGVIAEALAAEQPNLKPLVAHIGQSFPPIQMRAAGKVTALGADTERWLRC